MYDEYWHRLWILQELSLASHTCVILGDVVIDEPSMHILLLIVRDWSKPVYYEWLRRQRSLEFEDYGTRILDTHPIYYMRRSSSEVPELQNLACLLKTHVESKCQNPRDRVYGLLGMTSSHLRIDYRCLTIQVLLRTMRILYNENRPLNPPRVDDTDSSPDDTESYPLSPVWKEFDPEHVACIMRSLKLTPRDVQAEYTSSIAQLRDFEQEFELEIQASTVLVPCGRRSTYMAAPDHRQVIVMSSKESVHYSLRSSWFGPKLATHYPLAQTAEPLLVCAIGKPYLPMILLKLEKTGRVCIKDFVCLNPSYQNPQHAQYKYKK